MEALIAKRYVRALASVMGKKALANTATLFAALAEAYEDKAFADLINNPDVEASVKEELLLSLVKSAKSEAINNLMKLLVEKRRLGIIPAMAEELRLTLARMSRTYTGKVYSNETVEAKTLETMAVELGKKMDAKIALDFIESDYDGIKVEVEDLGVEIDLSKSRLNAQLVEHILKAI
jgi:F-type H+-transporting ATPase subunit delta